MNKKLKILFVAAECSPYIKVGGLGDVAGELPLKLKELGVDVRVVIPGNADITYPTQYVGDFPVEMGWRRETCVLRKMINAPVETFVVDNYNYLGRQGVYGHSDDDERFAFFSKAVYQMILRLGFMPDVLHLNDWHTAPLSMLIRENEQNHSQFSDISILYTIHNLEYQGIGPRGTFKLFGVRAGVFMVDKVEYYGCFNAMKAGINYSDIINAVSKSHANDMLTKEFGFGLDGVLQKKKSTLRGVINGINEQSWNPETDKALLFNYNKIDLSGKTKNKVELQKELGLEQQDVPLFSVISRLAPNKGLDLMEPAFEYIIKNNCQLVVLGCGEKYYENLFASLMERYPGQASVNLEFNSNMARRIFAGSDALLMPSRYEPCGISQLIAMRYGTIPIVHRIGGLADTIIDEYKNSGRGTGFSFVSYSGGAFNRAIKKAITLYNDKKAWTQLIKRAMNRDSSWDSAGAEYLNLYNEAKIINNKRKAEEGV